VVHQEKVDLIHSTLPDQNFYSCIAGRIAGCKTIVTYQSAFDFLAARQPRQALKLWFTRHSAAAIVGVTEHIRETLIALKFPPEKTVRIYNCISPERFRTSMHRRFRRELGCPPGTKLIGMVANLSRWKGCDYFIQAARKVADAMPNTRFVAVGEMDKEMTSLLPNLVRDLSLQDHFSFPGFREDVPEILADLDVFVLSSVSEGLPLAVLEAMAAGKPVVVTRSGGPQEFIEDGRTGFLVPPADSDALAEKILKHLRNPQLACDMGRAARERIKCDFAVEKMIASYEQLYERCLGVS
jgi:glycosyltransferase involved in cell wall biosynthesis